MQYPCPSSGSMITAGSALRLFASAIAVSAALSLASVAPLLAQSTRDLKCTGNPDLPWNEQIGSCSEAIASGQYSGHLLASLLNNRGNAYGATGNIDRALADFNEAIRIDPQQAKAFNNRGYAYELKGDLDHAIADFDEAIRLDPNYAGALNNRGGAYVAKLDPDRAIPDLDEAIRLNPRDAAPLVNRCRAYAIKKGFDRALADCDASIRLNPKATAAFVLRGNVREAKRRP